MANGMQTPGGHIFQQVKLILTLKAPITTAADDKFCDIFF